MEGVCVPCRQSCRQGQALNPFAQSYKVYSMRLISGLSVGRESLMSNGSAITAVADNLANSNTPGHKAQRPEFQDIFAENVGTLYGSPLNSGSGTKVQNLTTIQSQGPIQPTGRELDVGIQGGGYFVVQNGTDVFYTRAGNFQTNSEGQLVTQDGAQVMGFTSASPTTAVALAVNQVGQTATPTTAVSISGNIDATKPTGTGIPANPTYKDLNESSAFRTSVQTFDSLGQGHDVTLHFFKTGQLSWDVQAYVDSKDTTGTAGTPVAVGAKSTITFDGNGLQTEAGKTITIQPAWGGGAAAGNITVDLSGVSGFASNSYIGSVTANGNSAGAVVGTTIDSAGKVYAVLDNTERVEVGTLSLAIFQNTQGLERVGDNKYRTTSDSGDATLGAATVNGRGSITPGALEISNVDTASQFIDVIRYQRGYQAGSQIIKTISDLLNSTIQIA